MGLIGLDQSLMEPKERLKRIDELLQKGWQSFYDFAKAI